MMKPASVLVAWISWISGASAFMDHLPITSNNMRCIHSVGIPTTPSSSTYSPTRLYDAPEPLAEEGSWQAFLDEETTGLVYYFDTKTGESLWEPPTTTFPEVRLPRRKQRLADTLRREYRQARRQESVVGGNSSSSTITNNGEDSRSTGSSSIAIVEPPEEKQKQPLQQGPNWIDGIFVGDAKGDGEKASGVRIQQEEMPKPQPWFAFGGGKKEGDPPKKAIVADDTSAEPQNWLKDIFGVGKEPTGSSITEETVGQTTGKKSGLLESFASFSSTSITTTSTTTTDKEEQSTKPMEKPITIEKKKPVVVVEEKPKQKQAERVLDTSPKPIQFEIGSHILPHPAKVRWGGEDAIFIKGRTFGVFDGVSGADKLDGVPLYSRTLANEMKKMVGNDGVTVQDMTRFLTDAAAYADGAATGASTAVVASIGENGYLQALNVGDSYCVVVRDGKITAKTREISHYWECPYQLSEDSPDRPRDGTKLNVELIPGDVIVMGSDGVFDNVSDDLLLEVISKCPPKAMPLAKKICDLSRKQSLDKNSDTPYAKQAQRRGDPDYKNGFGGKVDDVSCVVVICK